MQIQIETSHRCSRSRVQRARHTFLACAIAGLLAACSDAAKPPPTGVAAPAGASKASAVASARGRVDIEGGVIRLAARRDGVIANVLVEEGDRVKAGQVLATLDADLTQRNLELARREVLQAEQEGHKAALEFAAAEREVRRLEPLAANETVSRQELDRARDAQALAGIARGSANAAVQTARARQQVAARELEERKVIAPLDGEIIQRQARPGNGVSTLNVTPLFLFAPDSPRIVRAELEEQYLAATRPGQPVQVLLEAQPERVFTGQVLRMGRLVGARTPSEDPTERQDNRVVEVVITLSDAKTLLIGQRVVVRFLRA
jgi:RND family efflux transporter MFP subunit